jgi:uncharacterized repeat protein (TIGR01451 family)
MPSVHQRSGHHLQVLTRVVVAFLTLFGLMGWPAAAVERGEPLPAPGERFIVQLDTAVGLASDLMGLRGGQGLEIASDQAGVAAFVSTRVSQIPGASVEARFERLYQGLVVQLASSDARALHELRNIPGVRAVYPDTEFSPTLYDAVNVTGVDQVWAALGGGSIAGADVRVAVIDSGIDVAHPMFVAPGWTYPAGYPVGWPAYTSPKVVAARAYFRPDDPPADGEGTPAPGAAGSLHGTHLAAVAAGMPVNEAINGQIRTLSGVAPGARLMNYRVFYPSASDGYERAFAVEIIQAIEDAVADGADILCLGWSDGGDQLPFASPVADAIRAAIAQGVVVIAPAGNDGPGPDTASRLPGGIEEVLTVGALGAPYGRALFGPAIDADTPPLPLKAVASVATGADPYACSPLPASSLTGSAALIERGGCAFATKVYMVQQAGAALALIVNSSDEVTDMACTGDYCGAGVVTIPGAMLASVAGQQFLNWAQLGGAVASIALSASGRVLAASPEIIAPFSARGPAYGLYLKPDLVGPGVAVISAAPTANPGANYVSLSGTSVAAAHVAGAAAILRAEHPTWEQSEIKSAMMGSARVAPAGALDEPRPAMGVLDYGAGLLDLPRAFEPTLLLEPASISLGKLAAGAAGQVEVLVRDVRTAGLSQLWEIATTPSAGLSVVAPATVTTEAGADTLVTLSYSLAGTAQGDVSAVISFSSGLGSYRLPLWGAVQAPPAVATVLVVDNDLEFSGGGVDTLPSIEAALRRLGVGYAVWPSDSLAGALQTWPSADVLSAYRAVIWTLGEKRSPDGTFATSTPPTTRDQQALMGYLDGGGRLLVMGQNVASATDVNPDPDPVWGRSTLYRHYLGAHWLRDNVFVPTSAPPETVAVTGLPATLLQGVLLDLGALGSGAGNQHSIDELGLGGSPGGDPLVRPVAAASGEGMAGAGYVMITRADEPALEEPTPDIRYRVLHQSFGLEGVNDRREVTYAHELLDRQLKWLLDEVTVTFPYDLVGGPYALARLTSEATSSVGSPFVSYRWKIGEGATARIVTSSGPVVYVPFDDPGDYALTVEATDALGHSALGQDVVRIVPGGASDLSVSASTALAGDGLVYTIKAVNTGSTSLSGQFAFPLPAGVTYVAHTGNLVTYTGGVLRWAGTLGPLETRVATMSASVNAALSPGTLVTATADFAIEGATFRRTVTTVVFREPLIYFPLIRR